MVKVSTTSLIELLTVLGGAVITALAGYYTAKQQRKQSQISLFVDAIQKDNQSLREENRNLRSELEAERNQNKQRRRIDGQHHP